MLAIHRKSTNICMHTWTVSLRSYTLSASAHTLPSVTNSSAVRWSAVRSFFNTFLCKKRWVHHNRHQLVQLCQSLEPQGVLRHWQAQSAHVSIPTVVGFLFCFLDICIYEDIRWQLYACMFQGSCERRCFRSTGFPWREDHRFRHPGNQWTDSPAAASSMHAHGSLLHTQEAFDSSSNSYSLCSRSTTWAPVVMVAMAAMDPMSSWWASAHPVKAMGTLQQGTQQRTQARPSPPGLSRRSVKMSTCSGIRTLRLVSIPHLPRRHLLSPNMSRRRPMRVSPVGNY